MLLVSYSVLAATASTVSCCLVCTWTTSIIHHELSFLVLQATEQIIVLVIASCLLCWLRCLLVWSLLFLLRISILLRVELWRSDSINLVLWLWSSRILVVIDLRRALLLHNWLLQFKVSLWGSLKDRVRFLRFYVFDSNEARNSTISTPAIILSKTDSLSTRWATNIKLTFHPLAVVGADPPVL